MPSTNIVEAIKYFGEEWGEKILQYKGHYLTIWIVKGPMGSSLLNKKGFSHWWIGFEFSDLNKEGDKSNLYKLDLEGVCDVLIIEIAGGFLEDGPTVDGRYYAVSNGNHNIPNTMLFSTQTLQGFDKWKTAEGRKFELFLVANKNKFSDIIDALEHKLKQGYNITENNCQDFACEVVDIYDPTRGKELRAKRDVDTIGTSFRDAVVGAAVGLGIAYFVLPIGVVLAGSSVAFFTIGWYWNKHEFRN
jgi:hypothetical protein